jgi:hypothetical protein
MTVKFRRILSAVYSGAAADGDRGASGVEVGASGVVGWRDLEVGGSRHFAVGARGGAADGDRGTRWRPAGAGDIVGERGVEVGARAGLGW